MNFYSAYQPGLRPGRRMHAPRRDRRPRGQCRIGPADGPRVPRRRRRPGRLPGADAVRLLHRGHPAAGRSARRRRGCPRRNRRGLGRPVAGAGGRRPAALSAPHLQHRSGHPPRRAARRGAQVVSAHLPGVLRAPPDWRPATTSAGSSASATSRPRSGPTCCSPRPTCPTSCCTSKSVRTCSCRFRRARRRRWRARRCWPTCPAARSPSAAPKTVACWPARRRRDAWPPTSMPPRGRANRPPTWPGTARP